ncbi:branched-chain amino acid ABC transporter permease [Prosthecodimorpha staleyi]|uniref:Branched-chain amino acid ABC transporter permease n=1 Tax=Prosthecodimorpha staleyi TaxID=2840188 RepID=A0A947D7Q9_9HYPH|nr:branched-chain amino acid ABC transporter permease [Prosthecodimorpha staleyi]MBT9289737.1 branched-chain amino acid ABC transporter permease [Prosthecodimorpha staleyi]
MDWTLLGQQIANGVVNGMNYVLISTGLTLVFGVLRVINFAHGEFYMLGAFLTYFAMSTLGIGYLPAVLVATVAVGALGILVNRLFFWPLRKEHEFTVLLSSLGLALLVTHGAELGFGHDPKYLNSPFTDDILEVGSIVLTQQRVLIFAAAVLVLAATYAAIRWTTFGRMMRATAQNPEGAALTGVDIRFVHTITFVLACGLAGLAGALVGPVAMIFPTVGSWAVLKGFIVVILGGLGSVPGALVGGLTLGVVEALAGGYVSLGFMEAIGYAIIILVLLWRPQGLFGSAAR